MAMKSSIEQLNDFLRGELSAVETYRIALTKLDRASTVRPELEANMRSHEERVELLRSAIVAAGGEPTSTSGAWGAFAKTIQKGAAALGDKAAIRALEEGEDHGLADYRSDIDDLDATSRDLVERELLPLQEQTHRAMSQLKHQFAS